MDLFILTPISFSFTQMMGLPDLLLYLYILDIFYYLNKNPKF